MFSLVGAWGSASRQELDHHRRDDDHEQRRDGMHIVTVSIGAALTRPQTGAKLEKIIHEADRALYLAKANGRNSIRLFDPNDSEISDEGENIAALLKVAISRDLVSLAYQPIRNIVSGKVEAAEALMRFRTPDGTSVPPSLFIPVAEQTGMILELGRWAIRTACQEILAGDHLDVVSVRQLEGALLAYEGAFVAVSHDERFLREINADRWLRLSDGRLIETGAPDGV
jgi:predicted signal transduction protein with EAL and GGDEF domain